MRTKAASNPETAVPILFLVGVFSGIGEVAIRSIDLQGFHPPYRLEAGFESQQEMIRVFAKAGLDITNLYKPVDPKNFEERLWHFELYVTPSRVRALRKLNFFQMPNDLEEVAA